MKAWAGAVEWLDIHCRECRSIADRIVRSESLLDDEKHQIEHHVIRTYSRALAQRSTARHAYESERPKAHTWTITERE
jgi:hypothetical protein